MNIYGIAHESGIWRVYRLLDPHKADKENNRRYLASSDREDRARELMGAFATMPETVEKNLVTESEEPCIEVHLEKGKSDGKDSSVQAEIS